MKRNISSAISILLAFCVVFSGLPLLAGSLDVNAASVTKKKITLKATVTGKTTVKLKWNKVKSPGKGYAVFRDGKVIKRLSTKKTSFTDKGLKPDTKHKYQIKTYTKKKVTKWYNKKTKKWQKKKPPKKYRGKSKKVTVYVYKKKSNIVRVKTKGSNDETPEDTEKSDPALTYYTITWKNWDGSVLKTDSVKAGATPSYSGDTPTRPEDSDYTYTFKGWSPSVVAASSNKTYTAQYTATAKPVSQYTYDIKFINEPYGNGGETAIYLATNNPNRFNISIAVFDSNGNKTDGNNYYGGQSSNSTYKDLGTLTSGYISIFSPLCSGPSTIVVYEDDDNGDLKQVASKAVNIKDYQAEEKAWRQGVIKNVCTDSMTNKERIQAICTYILSDFKYPPNYSGQYVLMFKNVGKPYWVKKELDSDASPLVLVAFGKDLNYPLEDMGLKYERETPEWTQYHMYAYSAADDCYFQACPQTNTGTIDPSEIVMFDPATYQFWGE